MILHASSTAGIAGPVIVPIIRLTSVHVCCLTLVQESDPAGLECDLAIITLPQILHCVDYNSSMAVKFILLLARSVYAFNLEFHRYYIIETQHCTVKRVVLISMPSLKSFDASLVPIPILRAHKWGLVTAAHAGRPLTLMTYWHDHDDILTGKTFMVPRNVVRKGIVIHLYVPWMLSI